MSEHFLAVRAAFSKFTGIPEERLTVDTRVDEHVRDELAVIEFVMAMESLCACDIPDTEAAPRATLGQLAVLAERYSKSRARVNG
jgi:acyl carrier protein